MDQIDVVYTWVDGAGDGFSKIIKERDDTVMAGDGETGVHRFRDNGELRYSLRSLERYADWTNNIYIVTNGDIPRWIKCNHPRLTFVDHSAIFPDCNDLPTFNSNAIELCLHRIKGLSKRFLYMNDDVFFGRASETGDFLSTSGGIRFYLEPIEVGPWGDSDSVLKKSYFHTRKVVEETWGSEELVLLPAHTPQLYDRDILAGLEDLLPDHFRKTISNRFRSPEDLALRILFYYYLLKGEREKTGGHEAVKLMWGSSDYSFWMMRDNFWESTRAFLHLLRKKPRIFCVNDDVTSLTYFHPTLFLFRQFLKGFFPGRSSFEK